MILVALEVGQHVVPAPAVESELAPMVVVGSLAAHIDHGVDRGRAADRLAARITEAAAIEPFLRLSLEAPVRAWIADSEQIADGDVKPYPIVAAARFEKEHAFVAVGGKPIGEEAAGRACADDDVIVLAFDRLRLSRTLSHAALQKIVQMIAGPAGFATAWGGC